MGKKAKQAEELDLEFESPELDGSIEAVFAAIDALPEVYIRKLKVLRVAVKAFNQYRKKIVQEFNYRKSHSGLPGGNELLQQAQTVYDEKIEPPKIPEELKAKE